MKRSEEPKDIQKLTEEIRKLGVPYSSEEPEPLFWANQRVRIMDRISGTQKPASITDQVIGWVSGHVMGTSIAGAALAILIAAAIVFNPLGNGSRQIAMAPQTSSSASVVKPASPQVPEKPPVEKETIEESIAQVQGHAQQTKAGADHQLAMRHHNAKPSVEMAALTDEVSAPVLSSSDVEHPVSLEDLSQPELEDVLHSIQSSE